MSLVMGSIELQIVFLNINQQPILKVKWNENEKANFTLANSCGK